MYFAILFFPTSWILESTIEIFCFSQFDGTLHPRKKDFVLAVETNVQELDSVI